MFMFSFRIWDILKFELNVVYVPIVLNQHANYHSERHDYCKCKYILTSLIKSHSVFILIRHFIVYSIYKFTNHFQIKLKNAVFHCAINVIIFLNLRLLICNVLVHLINCSIVFVDLKQHFKIID